MKIIHFLKMGSWREIENVLRRSWGCSTLSMNMLIFNAFNMQNADERFPAANLKMLLHVQ